MLSVSRCLGGEGGLSPPLLCALRSSGASCVPVDRARSPWTLIPLPFSSPVTSVSLLAVAFCLITGLNCGRKQYQNHFFGGTYFPIVSLETSIELESLFQKVYNIFFGGSIFPIVSLETSIELESLFQRVYTSTILKHIVT